MLADENLVKNTYTTVFNNEYLELLKLFLAFGEVKPFAKNKPLFKEGEVPKGFYWILEGNCKVSLNLDGENEQIITIVGPGDFVGLTSCLNDVPYKKGCASLATGTQALFLPKAAFYQWLAKYPSITIPLLRQIESKIDRIENRATYFMRKTIDQRLAHAILLLNDKFGQNGDHFMKLRLSPQEFASFIGTTRTTIYRVLKRLEEDHLIEISNKRLRVLDDLALRSLAQNN